MAEVKSVTFFKFLVACALLVAYGPILGVLADSIIPEASGKVMISDVCEPELEIMMEADTVSTATLDAMSSATIMIIEVTPFNIDCIALPVFAEVCEYPVECEIDCSPDCPTTPPHN